MACPPLDPRQPTRGRLALWQRQLESVVTFSCIGCVSVCRKFNVLCTSSRLWIVVLWTVSLSCMRKFSYLWPLPLFFWRKAHNMCLGYLHTRWFSVNDTHYYYYYYYDFRCFLRTCSLAHFTIPYFNGVHIFNSGFASFLALLSYI